MNTIKSKINSFINYAENNTIKVLPTKQDILNIGEFVVVAIRQLRIHRLTLKINKLEKERAKLIDMNIAKYIDNHEPTTIEM